MTKRIIPLGKTAIVGSKNVTPVESTAECVGCTFHVPHGDACRAPQELLCIPEHHIIFREINNAERFEFLPVGNTRVWDELLIKAVEGKGCRRCAYYAPNLPLRPCLCLDRGGKRLCCSAEVRDDGKDVYFEVVV